MFFFVCEHDDEDDDDGDGDKRKMLLVVGVCKGFYILLFLDFSFQFLFFSCPPASTFCIHIGCCFLFRFFPLLTFLDCLNYSIPDNFVVFFLVNSREKTRS